MDNAHVQVVNNAYVWMLLGLYSLAMFVIYVTVPCVIESSSASFFNLNLLTADFYAVVYGIYYEEYKVG